MTLKQKVAVVTGSTSGIGLGIARALAGAGADVVLNGFGDAGAIEELRAGLAKDFGVRVGFHNADMSKPAEIADLIGYATREFGSVDVLVNNAGIQHVAPVEEFAPERWDAVIAINLSAVFHGIHHALAGMKQKGWGRIINIASVHGQVASVNKVAYVAAKHGVVGITKTVALETAGTGVTCNAICPGWVLTPLVQKQIDALAASKGLPEVQAKAELLGAKQPSGEFVTPDQLGQLAVFLCSDAAAQMTGANLTMDGGWTAQ
ncbi:3-hydroxybutyrate dehydrogenase [Azospirillum canadense]|uniref:3-hydroxybutyrate dehydrogenase n=1 Tax=Azospirillum canadense TaxID=403962 RepID=UPI002225BBA5|nr:3-hydroxybutyrate dehydrogenase [Azospirillum canadense]MCW2243882.1 3-hydroxybutyrate dehydrogenase [Azospirillum canadense]